MIWLAPAKLNLSLHIVGRRPDGYHLLQSIFQFLDYYDELSFRVPKDGDIVRTDAPAGVPADTDLTLRAAQLLRRTIGGTRGVEITLRKRIPIGGGLGGGSSDAATTLLALNELWHAGLDRGELAALGLTLGADVPLFIYGQAGLAEGIGEALTPVDLPAPWYLVVVPPVHVPTAEIYGAFAASRGLTPPTVPRTIRDLRAGLGHNDLETVVRERHPAVEAAFKWLTPHGRPRMTGSGGCVFIELEDANHGRGLLEDLPPGFSGFVARGMNQHPLYRHSPT